MDGFMNKLEAALDKYMTPVAEVLNNNIVISGIKDGMMSTLPATMIASVALILSSFPYLDQFCPPLSAAFKTFFGPINAATPFQFLILNFHLLISCSPNKVG